MRISAPGALVLGLLAMPAAALAAGSHQLVGCAGCHRIPRNTRYLDPATGQPYRGAAGMCLACHQDESNGGKGQAPISRHASHPFELARVDPRVARVPGELLREGGRFDCLGCHDPHPSNRNFGYLRVDVGPKGERIDRLCAMCHPAKADPSARTSPGADELAGPQRAPPK